MTSVNALTADAVAAIRDLVKRDHVDVEFAPLPKEALGGDTFVDLPHVAIIRQGDRVEIQSLDTVVAAARGKPFSRVGSAKVTTLASFVALVNHHKTADTVVFVDTTWTQPKFTAVIDYHTPSKAAADDKVTFNDPGARFGKHRVSYSFPLSDPWKAWVAGNGKKFDQAEFAAFLEDHVHEIAAPEVAERNLWEPQFRSAFATPNELIDLARGLEVRVNSVVKNRVRLQTGETQLVYEEEHVDGSGRELLVPGLFLLAVPPFHRGEQIRIPVRLRYRASGGAISWSYEMFRPDQFIDERLRDDVAKVEAGCEVSVFDGSPEMSI